MFLINPYIYGAPISYLVDDYSPVVAYSTQKISSTSTSVVRVRRSSDNAESNFGGVELTDGTMLTWVGTGGTDIGYIVKWYNQGTGGSTYDIVQAVASSQPFVVFNGVAITRNGIPALRFLTNDILNVTSTPFGQNNLCFFSVSDANVTNTLGTVLTLSSTDTLSYRIFKDTRTNKSNTIIRNTTPTNYFADMSTARTGVNTLVLLSSFVDGSNNLSGFDNGATGSTDTFTGTWTNNAIQLGGLGTGSVYLDGTISEVIGFATDKSADRTDIETNINDRFAIY